MRRTIELLVLALGCVLAVSHASPARPPGPKKTTTKTPAAGAPANANKKQAALVAALRKLKDAANTQQSHPDADVLKRRVIERLKDDYTTEAALNDLRGDIEEWREMAKDLCAEEPCEPLVSNVRLVDKASNEYFGGLPIRETTPNPSQSVNKVPATDPEVNNGKKETNRQLREEILEVMGEEDSSVLGWVKFGALALTPVLALGLFAFAFIGLHQTRRDLADLNNYVSQALITLKNRQEGLSTHAEGLAATNADLFGRLAELSAEIGVVEGRVRGLKTTPAITTEKADGDGRRIQPPPQPEPPAFPISADAYLRKMQRHATVVKPDFQNGILVPDFENKGELVLVQDTSISHDTLFVVPRAAQFQMKQDFYTYYERYYDCERPASGTVWIVDPAVVERVQGGWELREKGVLEVR